MLTSAILRLVKLASLLGLSVLPFTTTGLAQGKPIIPTRSVTIDPCTVASANTLRSVLAAEMDVRFPPYHNDGEHVTISNLRITEATCPGLRITMRADLRYQKTRGFPQYSTSGAMRFRSPSEVRVRYRALADGPVTLGNIERANACLTDIDVLGLDLKRIPNWLDDGWIKEKVLDPKLDEMCVSVTPLVRGYLQQGGAIPPQ